MKILISFLLFSMFASAQTHELTLELATTNKDYIGHKIYIGYWSEANKNFPDADTFDFGEVLTIDQTVLTVTKSLPADTYAVSFYIDMNDNGKLDTNFFGQPKEPYGFSKNFKPKLAAPDFEDCSFVLSERTILKLDIID